MDIPLVNQTVEMMNPVVQQEQVQQNPIIELASKTKKTDLLNDEFWAKFYNADKKIPLKKRISLYNDAQDIQPSEEVFSASEFAVNSGAFDFEMDDFDISKNELFEGLLNISKVETSGGNLPKEKQISKTGAQGLFQVVESSAKDVLRNGQFGEKAAKSLGVELEDIKSLSKKELKDLLLNNDKANALFATAIIMQKLQNNRNKKNEK